MSIALLVTGYGIFLFTMGKHLILTPLIGIVCWYSTKHIIDVLQIYKEIDYYMLHPRDEPHQLHFLSLGLTLL
jgi:hypothetical protein